MTTSTRQFFYLNPTGAARSRLEEAERYFLLGNLNEALAAAQQAWREHPREPDVYRVLAYVHMARGEYQPAAQAAYQAVKIDGDNPASYASLAQVYATFNMAQLAEETLAAARERYPEDPALLVLEADVRFRRGREKEAAPLAEAALKASPNDAYAKALLGTYHLRHKRYHQARDLLADAAAAYPERWDYLRDCGIALLHCGQAARAREALIPSFRLRPEDARVKQYLLYALRLGQAAPYWGLSFFFYQHTGLAWLLHLLGVGCALTGAIWGIIAYVYESAGLEGLLTQTLLFFSGIALVVLTEGGIRMRGRRGKGFDAFLHREVERLTEGGVR